MLLNICTNHDVVKIINIVIIFIKIIRILVPILLMVSLMIDLIKPIISKEKDSLNKTLSLCLRKIILAILIFLLPNIVSVIWDIIGFNEYKQCIDFSSINNVDLLYDYNAEKLLNEYSQSRQDKDYNEAQNYINEISNIKIKEKYLKKLEETREK